MTDKEKISELKNLVEVLCDNISDGPAGCDACWLMEDGKCAKEDLYERMKAESEDENMKLIDGNIQALSITEYILKNKEKFIEILQKCDNDFLFALMMEYFDAQPGYNITLAQKAESEK